MELLCGRVGRLTALSGGFRPAQSNICNGGHCTRNVFVPATESVCLNGTSATANGCEDDLSVELDSCDLELQMDPWNSTVCEEWITDVEAVWAADKEPGCYDACTGKRTQARSQFDCENAYIHNGNTWRAAAPSACLYTGEAPEFVLHSNHSNISNHDMEELCEVQMSAYRYGGFIVDFRSMGMETVATGGVDDDAAAVALALEGNRPAAVTSSQISRGATTRSPAVVRGRIVSPAACGSCRRAPKPVRRPSRPPWKRSRTRSPRRTCGTTARS
jgi:hypothetical protein